MAISSSTQSNLNFIAFQTGLKPGEKSTISNIAVSARDNLFDSFHRTITPRPLGALTYSNGNGAPREILPVQTNQLTVVQMPPQRSNSPWEFVSQRLYGNEEEESASASKGSAGFTVDSTVNGGNGAPEDDEQTKTNLRQAAQIREQTGKFRGDDGGLESLARDLAILGLDFTALNDNPEALVEKVRDRTLSLLDKLATSNGSVAERNRLTGASARLVNGIQSSSGAFFSVDSSTDVEVDGTVINGDAAYSVGSVVVDPLVLDMNGDGINLSSAGEGVEFDLDSDGVKTKMGFIQGDDALLFVDEHGDGLVHDGGQLFGNTDGHANGFEELASHDDNNDGVIDRNDAIWDKLQVWVEKTADGVSTDDETMSLEEAGIESINVGYENTREDDGKGNLIGQTGSFARTDGTSGLAADAWLQEIRVRGQEAGQ